MEPQQLNSPNGNGVRLWWRVPVAAAALAWSTWITINVANYVSGEARGERLSTIEARLMIEQSDTRLRIERDEKIKEIEARIYEKIRSLDEQFKGLNERLRLDELKRNP